MHCSTKTSELQCQNKFHVRASLYHSLQRETSDMHPESFTGGHRVVHNVNDFNPFSASIPTGTAWRRRPFQKPISGRQCTHDPLAD
jgi:hypothetical protein